jgi:general secretion pathway protein A
MLSAYYGFSDKPFELSPDIKFLYLTSGYQEALDTVRKGITDQKGLIILTGEVGTGKTMLIYTIMAHLPAHIKTAFIFHSTYNFEEMLEQIFSEIGGSPQTGGRDNFKIRILTYLKKLRDQGKLLAVFIDEAQKLSQEVLRGLLTLLDSEPWVSETLQLVLVGQSEFEENQETLWVRYGSRISPERVRINSLSRKESLDYIEHRLRIAGRSSLEIFSPQALSLISEYAGGIPRLINIVCDNALFTGYYGSLKKIDLDTVQKVIRNLEGPEKEFKVRRKGSIPALPWQSGYRLSGRQRLLIFGVALGMVIFLWPTEFTVYLTDSRRPGFVQPPMGKRLNSAEVLRSQKESRENSAGLPLIAEEASKPTPKNSLEKQIPLVKAPAIRGIQVARGMTLSDLTLQYYGKLNESLIDLVLFYNPTIKNIDLILVDQKIQLPALSEEALIIPAADKTFRVHLGTFPDLGKTTGFNHQSVLKGTKITIQPKSISLKQKWYRLEAGPFENRQEALEAIKTLRGKGLLPFF